jgi:hypothetical protein
LRRQPQHATCNAAAVTKDINRDWANGDIVMYVLKILIPRGILTLWLSAETMLRCTTLSDPTILPSRISAYVSAPARGTPSVDRQVREKAVSLPCCSASMIPAAERSLLVAWIIDNWLWRICAPAWPMFPKIPFFSKEPSDGTSRWVR